MLYFLDMKGNTSIKAKTTICIVISSNIQYSTYVELNYIAS